MNCESSRTHVDDEMNSYAHCKNVKNEMQCVSYAFGTYGVDKMSLELCSVEAWSYIAPNTRSAQCILCHLLLLGTAAPLLLTLDTALAACFDSWSLNQPSYSFGMPFPPSMRGMNAVAGQAISRRAQIKRTIIVVLKK